MELEYLRALVQKHKTEFRVQTDKQKHDQENVTKY